MKSSPPIVALIALAVGLFVAGCRHALPSHGSDVGFYGQAGDGKIKVFVGGYVSKPGRYYLSDGVSLAEVPGLVGGWSSCRTCGGTPHWVYVTRGMEKQSFTLTEKYEAELKAFRLHDGDTMFYTVPHM
jgi:hypothetical protein